MARKRDSAPDRTLAIVVHALKHPQSARVALGFLFEDGPLLASGYSVAAAALTPGDLGTVRQHLLDVLRHIVEHPEQPRRLAASAGDWAVVMNDRQRVVLGLLPRLGQPLTVEDIQHAAATCLLFLAHVTGLEQVRACKAPDCGELFVRAGKRTYHSERCQQRHFKQQRRANERLKRERRRRLRLAQRRVS